MNPAADTREFLRALLFVSALVSIVALQLSAMLPALFS
jgi:hypothetical protein